MQIKLNREQGSGRNVTTADGLTGKQCLQRYLHNMHEGDDSPFEYYPLTRAQKELASLQWSAQLRAKVAEQKVKDDAKVVSVLVDVDNE